ncbi:MAG: imidazole glycerol phosphate synthase subunit HisH [Rhodocyclaceae bacterium]
MIAIIDYGMGNLKSVYQAISEVNNALQHKQEIIITADKAKIDSADKIIFPGQGAMPDCMQEIEKLNLKQTIINAAKNKPFLGICLGFQMLFTHSQEGNVDGLNIFAGKVVRFENNDSEKLKIPHMGWNNIYINQQNAAAKILFNNVENSTRYYFVHSYYVVPDDQNIIAATCNYGKDFACAIAKDNIFATQFHPEKSSASGLQIIENFLKF